MTKYVLKLSILYMLFTLYHFVHNLSIIIHRQIYNKMILFIWKETNELDKPNCMQSNECVQKSTKIRREIMIVPRYY